MQLCGILCLLKFNNIPPPLLANVCCHASKGRFREPCVFCCASQEALGNRANFFIPALHSITKTFQNMPRDFCTSSVLFLRYSVLGEHYAGLECNFDCNDCVTPLRVLIIFCPFKKSSVNAIHSKTRLILIDTKISVDLRKFCVGHQIRDHP